MKTLSFLPVLSLAAGFLTALPGSAWAADPASGTLSPSQPVLSYSTGPDLVPNPSATLSPAAPTCELPQSCDDFTLNVELPANYAAQHPRALIRVVTRWPVNNFFIYNLYLLDVSGQVLTWQATEANPVTVSLPAASGQYTIRILQQQLTSGPLSTTVTLTEDPSGGAAAGIAPRFQVVRSPPGLGDQVGGEMNVGFNPFSQRVMSLSYTQTLRTTFPENFSTPLPECCDALWEDVSDPLAAANTNDPILVTDPATGRTFVSQLQGGTPGHSIFVYTDDDGDNWTLSPTTMNGGTDHQSVGVGPYAPGAIPGPLGAYPNAVYYCSQSVVAAFCIRSDDGGQTFTAPSVLATAASCDGFTPYIHGHVRVAPDGTAYVPERNCGGEQALFVSEDNGLSWQTRRIPGSVAGHNDSSVGIASDGTLYYCYVTGDARAHVTVSRDHGLSWSNDRDIGSVLGVVHAVFPNAIAGDPDRASCAFLGTATPGNYQSPDFAGLWHVYIATTYDGGATWHTANPDPADPVQGVGGICLGGTTCLENRNLLDFNEITLDDRGRPIYGYNDGCISENCITTGQPDQVVIPGLAINSAAKSTLLRQSGGRTLYAAFDAPEPAAPKAACLSGGRDETLVRLAWKLPDHGGAAISGYRIYRGTTAGAETLLAETGPGRSFDDVTAAAGVEAYHYKITALNNVGEGLFSNTVTVRVGDALPSEQEPVMPAPLPEPTIPSDDSESPDRERWGGGLGLMQLLLLLAGVWVRWDWYVLKSNSR